MAKQDIDLALHNARELSGACQNRMVCVMGSPDRTQCPQIVVDDDLHKHLVQRGWSHLAYFRNGERIK